MEYRMRQYANVLMKIYRTNFTRLNTQYSILNTEKC